MKILFCAQHFSYVRNYESVVRALSARGHQVHVAAERQEQMGGRQLVERLTEECPGVTWGWSPALEEEPWFNFAAKLRHTLQYVRFLDPAYDDRPKYRERAAVNTPRVLRRLLATPLTRPAAVRRLLAALLVRAERLMPSSARLEAFLREASPDVVLLASVTNPGSPEMDHLKAARRMRIPVAMCVFSWDHLSGKSWIRIAPDQVIVWNETQRREAIEEHFLPADRVVTTGAQCWDQWFDRAPSRSREAFCRDVGLDPLQPFVLYVCSVLSRPAPNEAQFVIDWLRRLRASDDQVLRHAGVLIRPHPERMDEWDGVDLPAFSNVAFRGRNPVDPAAKDDYFDSMHYASSVVGIVTSAFIEAAVAGREVLTIELPEFALHQRGAPHFRYLVDVAGGLLHSAPDFDGHFAQLRACLGGASDSRSARNRRFLEAFVRPHGLDVPATPRFVEAVERLAASGPAPLDEPASPWLGVQRALVHRLAAAGAHGFGEWLLMDVRDAEHAAAEAAKARGREQAAAEKEERVRARQRDRDARLKAKQVQRREKGRRRSSKEHASHGNVA